MPIKLLSAIAKCALSTCVVLIIARLEDKIFLTRFRGMREFGSSVTAFLGLSGSFYAKKH